MKKIANIRQAEGFFRIGLGGIEARPVVPHHDAKLLSLHPTFDLNAHAGRFPHGVLHGVFYQRLHSKRRNGKIAVLNIIADCQAILKPDLFQLHIAFQQLQLLGKMNPLQLIHISQCVPKVIGKQAHGILRFSRVAFAQIINAREHIVDVMRLDTMSEAKYTLEESGSISVQNLSAYWIPEQSIRKVIHGTTYVVTGSYSGTELFTKKLERIMARSFITTEALENTEEMEA